MRLAGNLGDESGSGGGKQMPWVRFTSISQAADFSFNRARDALYQESNGAINHYEDEYVDPDFADLDDDDAEEDDHAQGDHINHNENYEESSQLANKSPFGQSPFTSSTSITTAAGAGESRSQPNGDHHEDEDQHHPTDLPYLSPPTPQEINSIVLSLISQGFLKGFVQHSQPDLLQSRFAIPGVRKPSSHSQNPFGPAGGPTDAWKETGFPKIWDVVCARYREWDGAADAGADVDVPGWITAEKVLRRERRNEGGGRIIYLSGVRPAGS